MLVGNDVPAAARDGPRPGNEQVSVVTLAVAPLHRVNLALQRGRERGARHTESLLSLTEASTAR